LFGMICSLFLVIPVLLCLYILAIIFIDNSYFDHDKLKLLAWLGIIGMQGSIVSMFLGLRKFRDKDNLIDSLDIFLNTLVRPYIGFSFAILTFFMLESGILQDNQIVTSNSSDSERILKFSFEYHVCISFVSGFTERVAKFMQSENAISDKKQEELKEDKMQ
jgi:hypothetical protein